MNHGNVAYRKHICLNCGHIQAIQTNHDGGCFDYCGRNSDKGCSWKPSYGNPAYAQNFFGRTYRPFVCVEMIEGDAPLFEVMKYDYVTKTAITVPRDPVAYIDAKDVLASYPRVVFLQVVQ